MKKLISISLALSLLLGSTAVSLPTSAEESIPIILTANRYEFLQIDSYPGSDALILRVETDQKPDEIMLMDGDTGEQIGVLRDDGAYTNSGDNLAGDGIYSYRTVISATEPAVYSYYVIADGVQSNTVRILVADDYTNDELNEISEVNMQIDTLLDDSTYQAKDTAARKEAIFALLNDLAENGTADFPYSLIDPDSIVFDETTQTFFFVYRCGEWSNGYFGAFYDLDQWNEVPIASVSMESRYHFDNFTRFIMELPERQDILAVPSSYNPNRILALDHQGYDEIYITANRYRITLEEGYTIDDSVYEQLSGLITQKKNNAAATVEKNPNFDTMYYYYAGSAYLIQDKEAEGNTWLFACGEALNYDEEAVLQILHALPGFQHIDYAKAGYFISESPNLLTLTNLTVTCPTPEGSALTKEDFAPYLELNSLKQSTDDPTSYTISLNGNSVNWYDSIRTLMEHGLVQSVDNYSYMITELAYDETVLIHDDPIRYLQNGDVNNDSIINADDAYETLTSYASCSVGKEDPLQPVQRVAADYDLNGQVDANDAYEMLLTYASNSVGKETD